jgi:hypothetical protein
MGMDGLTGNCVAHRDIVSYLKFKAGPEMDFLAQVSSLMPYLADLDRLETFERGIFAVVVFVFVSPPPLVRVF